MKKTIQILTATMICCLMININANAQTSEFEVNGLKVIHKMVPKEIVSARLFVKGGTANYPIEQSGIEDFAFQLAVTGGTESTDRLAFTTALEKLGSSVNASSTFDYGQFELSCLKKTWDESWALYADAIMNPTFDKEQFDILKEQLIANAKQAESDPDEALMQTAMSNVFAGKNYEKIPAGTPETLDNLTLDQLIKYYKATIGKDRSFLVVVGDITAADIKAKVAGSLAKMEAGTLPIEEERNMLSEASNKIADREIATNYITGFMSAPSRNSEDGIAMMMAMSILSERYFLELRTKRSLSYAPYSYYDNSKVTNPYSLIFISTTDPKQSMEVMVGEISKLKKEGYIAQELKDKKQGYLTGFYMGQETLSAQSQSLGTNELKGGWKMAETFTEDVNGVTLEDINRVIDKYTDVISWTYLGKEDMVSEGDFLQPTQFPDDTKIDKDK
ncbi:MAG: zinc protease [Marinoscillum sp.]|jgi:zinc protease